MTDLIRDEVRLIAPYNAGLTIAQVRERYGVGSIAKLGSNETPLGAGQLARAAFARAGEALHLYPDPAGRDMRRHLAAEAGINEARVILGNGSEDLLSVICRTVLRAGDSVVTPYPSFPLHEDYALLMGASVTRVPVGGDFAVDVPALIEAGREARLLFLANPLNPVGSWIGPDALAALARELPETCLLVVDEAYFEFARGDGYADGLAVLRAMDRPWIVLRTLSKAYGLASLRIGYGFAHDAGFIAMLDRVRTPFNVNGPAQAAGLAALADHDHLAQVVALACTERDRMAAELTARGYRVAPSRGNFVFFDCGGPSVDFAEALLRHGIITKPWKQPGYDTFVRVSAGAAAETAAFLAALPVRLR